MCSVRSSRPRPWRNAFKVKSRTRKRLHSLACGAIATCMFASAVIAAEESGSVGEIIQLGERPFYLIDGMDDGPLKARLQQCRRGPFRRTDFSIAHRGAPLKFPE